MRVRLRSKLTSQRRELNWGFEDFSRLSCKTGTLPKDANVYLVVRFLYFLSLEPKQVGNVEESTMTPVPKIRDGERINYIVNPQVLNI